MRGDWWNDERLALLKALWAAGATAQAIADQLGGVSRSAVLGKIFRLRRGAGGKTSRPQQADRALQIAPAHRRGKKGAAPPSAAAPVRQRGKSLLELTNNTCRWPHGRPGTARFFFCGASGADLEAGMPYCPSHARRAFRAREGRGENPNLMAAEKTPPRASTPRRYAWRAKARYPAPRWR